MTRFSTVQAPPPRDWQCFEDLCLDLWKRIWSDPYGQKNGRGGREQNGVDICGRDHRTGRLEGVQCKGKDNYSKRRVTVKELQKEVEKAKGFEPPLDHFILAITGPKDPDVERCAREISVAHRERGLFAVSVLGWADILALLDDYPVLASRHDLVPSNGQGSAEVSVVARRIAVVSLRTPWSSIRRTGLLHVGTALAALTIAIAAGPHRFSFLFGPLLCCSGMLLVWGFQLKKRHFVRPFPFTGLPGVDFNIECTRSGDLWLSRICGLCPHCEGTLRVVDTYASKRLETYLICENNPKHRVFFDPTKVEKLEVTIAKRSNRHEPRAASDEG